MYFDITYENSDANFPFVNLSKGRCQQGEYLSKNATRWIMINNGVRLHISLLKPESTNKVKA